MTARQPSVPNLISDIFRKSVSREDAVDVNQGLRQFQFRNAGLLDNLTHLLDRDGETVLAEQSRSANESVGPRMRRFGRRLKINPAIDTDFILQPTFLPPRMRLLDFGQRLVDKRLSTKPGINRHDQQRI